MLNNLFTLKNLYIELISVGITVIGMMVTAYNTAKIAEEKKNEKAEPSNPMPSDEEDEKLPPTSYIGPIIMIIGIVIAPIRIFTIFKSILKGLLPCAAIILANAALSLLITTGILTLIQKLKKN